MKEITYKISIGENGQLVERQEVNGFLAFDLFGYQWATHQDIPAGNWIISEVSTGFELESGKFFEDKEEASYWAWAYLLKKGEGLTRLHVEKARMKIQEYENKQQYQPHEAPVSKG